MKVNVGRKGEVFLKDIEFADTFWSRFAGYQLRLRPHVPGFVFEPANSIHTFWCFFPLDLVFLNHENKVIKVIRHMRPWRHTKFYFRSVRVLEVPAGQIPQSLQEGDVLEVNHV